MVCEAISVASFPIIMSAKPLSFAMLSHPGRVRNHNEDACAANPELGAFVVCDGVGGAASGEVASQLAAASFLELMLREQDETASREAGISAGVEYANRLVYRQSSQTSAQRGMATTMVALVFTPASECAAGETVDSPGTVWVTNIGDSRCYRLGPDSPGGQHGLQQLTRDHSVVEEQVRAGIITRQQAAVSPIRNVITRAIGSDDAVEADIECLAAQHGDLYLLCSDGLIRDLADPEIAAILLSTPSRDNESLAVACQRLIDAANSKGGGDNITCILVHIA